MHIDNITSEKMTFDTDGKSMQISIYEKNIEQLQQKNQKYKEVIDKIKKYIRLTVSEEEFIETEHYVELLEILKEVE